MPIVGIMNWGLADNARSPLSHPLLRNLEQQVRECNQINVHRRWRRKVYENRSNDLPPRKIGHYLEFTLTDKVEPGTYRLILGNSGEVFVTWDHYDNFLQILRVPGAFPPFRPPQQ